MAPRVTGLLETCLYVADLGVARQFYETVLGLGSMMGDYRFLAFDLGAGSVLLLFIAGDTTEPVELPGGVIPPHDGRGPTHIAFAVPAGSLDDWRQRLAENGVAVESEVSWPNGGHSLYFRDPDRHLVELATPGVWPNY